MEFKSYRWSSQVPELQIRVPELQIRVPELQIRVPELQIEFESSRVPDRLV